MATNNRLVDYNRSLMTTDTAFQTFLSNIQASANKYNLEALKECYAKLPIDWRNSEQIFLAGAWNIGNILGYNDVGGLISMPFSRGSEAYVWRDFDIHQVVANEPALCRFYGGSRNYGLHLFNELSTQGVIRFSTMRSLNSYPNFKTATGYNFNSMSHTVEVVGDTYNTYSSSNFNFWDYIIDKLDCCFWLDITDLAPNRVLRINPSVNSGGTTEIHIDYNGSVRFTGLLNINNVELSMFIVNGRRLVFINIHNLPVFMSAPTAPCLFITSSDGQPFQANPNCKVRIGVASLDVNKPYLYDNSWDSRPPRSEDALTITLTQPSDIFINTSKGAFTFYNQPAGGFDYKSHGIIDCKVYAIAIKFL